MKKEDLLNKRCLDCMWYEPLLFDNEGVCCNDLSQHSESYVYENDCCDEWSEKK